jgi:hypothetical protein
MRSRRLLFWFVSLMAVASFWYLLLTVDSSLPIAAAMLLGRCLQLLVARCLEAEKLVLLIAADTTLVFAAYFGFYELQGTAPGLVIVSLASVVVGLVEVCSFESKRRWIWISSILAAHLLAALAEQKLVAVASSSADPLFWRSARYLVFAAVAGLVRGSIAAWLTDFREKSAALVPSSP